jgi:two-component system, OmpR family, KDP operon response regulator KdpE
MNQGRILIVDDDPRIQQMLRSHLTARGYEVRVVGNGDDALVGVAEFEPDLLLLDISMPGMDGLQVCRELREWSPLPVILLTATDSPDTKITALDLGADDYLTKPFHVGELLARIRAVRRRAEGEGKYPGVLNVGDLTINLSQRQVHREEEELHLTKIEFDLLREFVIHANKVLTYSHLLEAVWSTGYADAHLVQVHVSNLRRKIERGPTGPRYVIVVPGVGYRFRMPD